MRSSPSELTTICAARWFRLLVKNPRRLLGCMPKTKSAANRRTENRRDENARRKVERLKARQRRRERRHRLGIVGSAGVLALGVAALTVAFWPADKPKAVAAPTGKVTAPALAPAATLTGEPIDGIQSGS